MEPKRISLSFLALCLALAFSVSPVEAGAEDTARKCSDGKDNDRNGLTDCADNSCVVGGFCNDSTTTLKVHLAGAFVFETDDNTVDVFLNHNGAFAQSDTDVMMTRPTDDGDALNCPLVAGAGSLAETWDGVFCTCGELLDKPPLGFSVESDDWRLNIDPGQIRFVAGNIEVSRPSRPAEIVLQLIGDPNLGSGNFPPGPNDMTKILLDQFAVHGSTVQGVHPRSGCQPPGGGGFDILSFQDLGLQSPSLTVCGENVDQCPPPPPLP